jgi:hypothetical protein
MYNKQGGGKEFAKYNSANLAWWHNYKHASLLIWKRFATTIIAPLWHELYPNSIFPIQPARLTGVTTHLMYLFLAYPNFKQQLEALDDEDVDLTPRYQAMKEDLVFLFEFAIPVVLYLPVFSWLVVRCNFYRSFFWLCV